MAVSLDLRARRLGERRTAQDSASGSVSSKAADDTAVPAACALLGPSERAAINLGDAALAQRPPATTSPFKIIGGLGLMHIITSGWADVTFGGHADIAGSGIAPDGCVEAADAAVDTGGPTDAAGADVDTDGPADAAVDSSDGAAGDKLCKGPGCDDGVCTLAVLEPTAATPAGSGFDAGLCSAPSSKAGSTGLQRRLVMHPLLGANMACCANGDVTPRLKRQSTLAARPVLPADCGRVASLCTVYDEGVAVQMADSRRGAASSRAIVTNLSNPRMPPVGSGAGSGAKDCGGACNAGRSRCRRV
mmetsp:Transcript_142685/g.355640  ORF Transcript_142685/g.355640 Transcript_142685/m.355640 type:complete len:304 (-) Transcript_142685:752-1663(-)